MGKCLNIIFSAMLVIFAAATVYLAHRQHQLEKIKLKLDSYPKRLDIYDAMKKFIAEIQIASTTDYNKCMDLLRKTKHAKLALRYVYSNFSLQ